MYKGEFAAVFSILANMMRMLGLVFAVPGIVAGIYGELVQTRVFLLIAIGMLVIGSAIRYMVRKSDTRKRHAIMSLAIAWIIISCISAIPFYVQGLPVIDALFEGFSGWTGSGFTMISNTAMLPVSLSVFRAIMQWVGGFGIVILVLLVYEKPSTAKDLFMAEGRAEDFFVDFFKIARMIVTIYFLLTLIGTGALMLFGVGILDAFIHSLTTISTGGFTSNEVGIGYFGIGPSIIGILLMCAGGISFMTHYDVFKGRLGSFLRNPEVRIMMMILLGAYILIMVGNFIEGSVSHNSFDELFYTVSALTGTGAGTNASIASFSNVSLIVIILLMITGCSYGSTSGAIKLWRIMIVMQVIKREIIRPFLPENAVVPLRVGSKVVTDDEALRSTSYIILYLALLCTASMVFLLSGYSPMDSIFTVASSQGNVGLNIMDPADFYGMAGHLKGLLILLMVLGRMEIIPFIIMLRGLGLRSKSIW